MKSQSLIFLFTYLPKTPQETAQESMLYMPLDALLVFDALSGWVIPT
jgi:hypothetical protein